MMSTSLPATARALGDDQPLALGTFADVWERLGRVPLSRIRTDPPIGAATEADAADSKDRFGVCCELVDNVLVAKPMGWFESRVAMALVHFLETWLTNHPTGMVIGPDGPVRTLPRNVRMPDVCYVSYERLPPREEEPGKVLEVAPELVVEVLSDSNTKAEMDRKLREYFAAGVRLVWYINPRTKTAEVYTAVDCGEHVPAEGSLLGRHVLHGFEVALRAVFDRADPRAIGQR